MKATQPLGAMQPTNMVVAVQSLTPQFGLLCLQPVEGYAAGTIRPVYGGNLNQKTVYTNGTTSKYQRMAADFEEYEHEQIDPVTGLPDYIEELNPKDYPGCYQLVITNAKVMPVPVPSLTPKAVCRVVTHPATKARQQAPKSGGKVLPLFPGYEPKKLQA